MLLLRQDEQRTSDDDGFTTTSSVASSLGDLRERKTVRSLAKKFMKPDVMSTVKKKKVSGVAMSCLNVSNHVSMCWWKWVFCHDLTYCNTLFILILGFSLFMA